MIDEVGGTRLGPLFVRQEVRDCASYLNYMDFYSISSKALHDPRERDWWSEQTRR